MAELNNYYHTIKNAINPSTSIVYLAIGCCMKHYSVDDDIKTNEFQITESNNQQYPMFMRKFPGRKVIILIDPELENPIKLTEIIPMSVAQKNIMTIYENSEMIIFAINKMVDYDENFEFIASLINITRENNTKMILQDYTGKNTTECYYKCWNQFGDSLLNDVIFDVTGGNEDCFVNFNDTMVQFDGSNHFIQPKYLKVSMTHDMKTICRRIDILLNVLSWKYNNMIESMELSEAMPDFSFLKNHMYLFKVYSINSLSVQSIGTLIEMMIYDIVMAKECDVSVAKFLIEKMYGSSRSNYANRSDFINNLSILKFD